MLGYGMLPRFIISPTPGLMSSAGSGSSSLSSRPGGLKIVGGLLGVRVGRGRTGGKTGGNPGEESCSILLVEVTRFSMCPDCFLLQYSSTSLILRSAFDSCLVPCGKPTIGPCGRWFMSSPVATALMLSAIASSAACCLFKATWAAITLCLS